MKLIALDVGTKRIGVAKADSSVRIAIPYAAVEVDGTEFQKLASLARAWDIDNFVIGLPRNSKGEETDQSKYVRKFAAQLKQSVKGAKICFQDESLTSVEAEKRLKNRKKGYKKGDIDSEAAAIILQDFLEQRTGKPTTRAAATKRKSVQGAKPHRFMTVVAAMVVLLGLIAGVGYGYYRYNLRAVAEVNCAQDTAEECDAVNFSIESGSGVSDIASSLKQAGLIRDSLVFQLYIRLNSGGKTLKAGGYELTKSMSVEEIADILLKGGKENVFGFTIYPGETIRAIKERLVAAGYDAEVVEEGFNAEYRGNYDWIFDGRPEGASLEGYLYGDTYEFYKDDTIEEIITKVLTEMASVLEEHNFRELFAAHELNLYQGITLASIVQREAKAQDQKTVAQVFYNRLREGMSLGSDVTTQYAMDLIDPERTSGMTEEEKLSLDSPYNTRNPNVIGLPYGPISNPGLSALQAVATPDDNAIEYLYFLTGDDNEMYYSSTLEGHNQNIQEFCQQLCNAAL